MISNYKVPDQAPLNNLIFELTTNNRGNENWMSLEDQDGNKLIDWNNLQNNTTYSENLILDDGCYTMKIFDSSNDGLSYWADPAAGVGRARIRRNIGPAPTWKGVEPEFGRLWQYSFYVGDLSTDVNDLTEDRYIEIYPNPSDGQLNLELSPYSGVAQIQVMDQLGRIIFEKEVDASGYIFENLDLNVSDGLYYLNILAKGLQVSEKILIQKP
jgi:hypothetical protein